MNGRKTPKSRRAARAPLMSRRQGRAFRRRWALAGAAELAEMRAASPALRLRQLDALASATAVVGRPAAAQKGVEQVRRRWQLLRKRLTGHA